MLRPAVLGALLVLAWARPVHATTAQDLCGDPVPDPCRITTSHTIEPGSVLDFRPASLVLATSSGRLDVGGGNALILARDVTLQAGGKLLGAGGRLTLLTTGSIVVDQDARIDVAATGGGGSIVLLAVGDVLVDGALRAAGIGIPAFGGVVVIVADGAVRLHDVDASGGTQAFPRDDARATVDVSAEGRVDLDGVVDVSHGECVSCSITVSAGGDLDAGKLDVHATGVAGDGGAITLDAGGALVLNGPLQAQGSGGDSDGGGSGGDVVGNAGGALAVNASIVLGGAPPDGDGGTCNLDAGGDLQFALSAVLEAEGGGEGCGGSTDLNAGRDLVASRFKLGGGSCGGGTADAAAGRDLTVVGRTTASATSDGAGGDVSLLAERTVWIDADLEASGPVAGSGGAVAVEGCAITVADGVLLQTNGLDGDTRLQAHGPLTVVGRLESGGTNTLAYGDPAAPPLVTGPVVPPTAPVLDPTLVPCGVASACGDGTRDVPEECDDAGTDSCDGCSATCTLEVCGNGRVDCNESCDPPDLRRCDAACQIIPQAVVQLPGSPSRHACQAEWDLELANAAVNPATSLPKSTQSCVDGDPACDADAGSDGRCTFRTRLCLGVDDSRRPDCVPAAIEHVQLKWPRPLDPADAIDAANVERIRDALVALGVTVTQGTTVIHAGTPDPTPDHCTAPFDLVVPHGATKARRRVNVGAGDVAGKHMSSNALKLDCFPNTAVCGDGAIGIGETCDDGGTQGCDGCSPTCRDEACGNGRIDCAEQCDDGPLNQPLGSACSARCADVPPALRIPAGGSRTVDCAHEWSLALDPGRVVADARGVARNRQDCVDGDPACDFDPAPGTCRFHLFACLGGDDTRLGCVATTVSSVEVLRPRAGGDDPLRDALVQAYAEVSSPIGPGEACTRRIDVDVPASRKRTVVKERARLASGKSDPDTMKLRCLPAP